jgi:prepilin-type processing-associated H-X9-DG protein
MERLKSITIIFLLAVGLLSSVAPAKTVSVLLQEGLYAEEIEGDLDAAIKIYEQVISESKETQRAAAQATYRIGMCYLKKGKKDKAAEYFQNIITDFPGQKVLAGKAEKQLDKIKPRAERIVEQAVMTISTCAEGDARVTRALESLKGLDENVVVSELVKFLYSETDTVRRSAIYILWKGNLSDISSAVPTLEKLCLHKEDITRGMAAIALGAAKVDSSFDVLCDMTLEDPSGYARRCAAYALGLIGNAEAKPILEKALEDSDPLVRNNAKAALTMLEPPAVGGFGPVMERVINDDGEEKHWLIDFDTGRLFSPSTEIRSEEALLRWIAENRIDAMGETKPSGPGLYGFDMAAIPIAAEAWKTISPKGLADDLSIAKGGTPAFMSAVGKLPVTYIFKTREGGMGVVQILEMQGNKKPRHFRIRYKMLQERVEKPAIANARSVAEAFLAAAVSGRDSEAIRLVKPGSAVVRQVKDFRQILEPEKLKIVSGYTDERIAVVTTTEISIEDQKGLMLIRLIKQRGVWMVEDIDLETPASLKAELDSFLQKYPNATKLPEVQLMLQKVPTVVKGTDQELQEQAESAKRLKQLGLAVAMFVNEHNSKLPDNLQELEPYVGKKQDFQWILDNVAYLGKGKTVVGSLNFVTAYDKTLLEEGNGTNVLFGDSHVEFEVPKRLKELGITPRHFRIRYKMLQKEKAKSPIDLSTPEATIKSFVKAVYDGNLEAAGACVSKDGPDYDEFKEMLATESNHPFQAMIKAMDVSVPIEITSKSIKDGRCKISWHFMLGRVYYFGDTKMKKGTHQEFSSYLELVGDKWLIRDI